MTDLRRIAQMVEDLQTLQVIKENDVIDFRMLNSKSISLSIRLASITPENDPHSFTRTVRTQTIKKAIKNEFAEKEIKFDDAEEDIYCRLLLKK